MNPYYDRRWELIQKKLREGSEADRKEAGVEILERILGHLNSSRRQIVLSFDSWQQINLSDAANFNTIIESINEVQKLYQEAQNDFAGYKHKYFRRFKRIREPGEGIVHDSSYG